MDPLTSFASPGNSSAQTAFTHGIEAWQRSDFVDAASLAIQAIQLSPHESAYYNLLGASYYRLGNLSEAVAAYRQATMVNPNYASAYSNLSLTLADQGKLREAEPIARQAIQLNPSLMDARCNLGIILARQGRVQEAKTVFLEVLKVVPDDHIALRNLGHAYKELGQFALARRTYQSVLQRNPRDGHCYEKLSQMRQYTSADLPKCSALEGILMDQTLAADDRTSLHYALGKMYEDIGENDLSFTHYRRAHDSIRTPFDRRKHAEYIDKLMGYFTPQRFARRLGQGSDSEQPVFVVGMYRSGTTLVEQILASHPRVFGAGELLDIPMHLIDLFDSPVARTHPVGLDTLNADDILRLAEEYLGHRAVDCGTALRVIDKMPHNFLGLGLIAFLFPRARVIHCRREPLDVGLSCYASSFAARPPGTHDLGDIGFCYRQYERLMKHWQAVLPLPIFDIRYEELIRDQVAVTSRLLKFCDLPWDDRCLDFHRTNRPILTASDWQVRQPLYATSVGRWRKFEKHLGPLMEELNLFETIDDSSPATTSW